MGALCSNRPVRKKEDIEGDLLHAATHGLDDWIPDLVKSGVNVNAMDVDGKIALNQAVRCHNHTFVKKLIKLGANVNSRDSDGYSALIMAASCGPTDLRSMEILLDSGADVNASCCLGITSLMLAVYWKNPDALKLLWKAGADVNITDCMGYTALLSAAYYKNSTALEMLILAGADVNAKLKCGRSAIGVAVLGDSVKCVKMLLKSGANVNIVDDSGNSALSSLLFKTANEQMAENQLSKILIAAGEIYTKNNDVTENGAKTHDVRESDLNLTNQYLLLESNTERSICLVNLCRNILREHLIKVDRHTNLFKRIPRLGLPDSLTDFLLYHVSLD